MIMESLLNIYQLLSWAFIIISNPSWLTHQGATIKGASSTRTLLEYAEKDLGTANVMWSCDLSLTPSTPPSLLEESQDDSRVPLCTGCLAEAAIPTLPRLSALISRKFWWLHRLEIQDKGVVQNEFSWDHSPRSADEHLLSVSTVFLYRVSLKPLVCPDVICW